MIYQLKDTYFVRPLAESDLEGAYPSWFEDQEVCRYNSHGKFFKNNSYFREYIDDSKLEDRMVWAVCHIEDGHIGNVALQKISQINQTAEFAVILGDKRHWGKGIGLLASKKIFEHGFSKINLERIYCGTASTNNGMKKLAKDLGMTHEGTLRQHIFLEGSHVDMLEYGILRSEFTNSMT
jgi:[ribosomal protein S5]-alanine N-acetyltransferase